MGSDWLTQHVGAKGLSRMTYEPVSWTQSGTFVSNLLPHLLNKAHLSQAVMIIQ